MFKTYPSIIWEISSKNLFLFDRKKVLTLEKKLLFFLRIFFGVDRLTRIQCSKAWTLNPDVLMGQKWTKLGHFLIDMVKNNNYIMTYSIFEGSVFCEHVRELIACWNIFLLNGKSFEKKLDLKKIIILSWISPRLVVSTYITKIKIITQKWQGNINSFCSLCYDFYRMPPTIEIFVSDYLKLYQCFFGFVRRYFGHFFAFVTSFKYILPTQQFWSSLHKIKIWGKIVISNESISKKREHRFSLR